MNQQTRSVFPCLAALCLLACSPGDEPTKEGATPVATPSGEASYAAETVEPATATAADGATGPHKPATQKTYRLKNLTAMNIRGARLEMLLKGLKRPWAMEFLDEETLILTEQSGRLLRYRLGAEAPEVIEGVPPLTTGLNQTGLLDVEVHPDFARNGRIYFSYIIHPEEGEDYFLVAVSTAVLDGNTLRDERRLLTADPPGWSTSNFGAALEFDDAGTLYVSVGDRSELGVAQRGDRLQGKILRLTDDGGIPEDNPFVDDPAIDDRIYALGVRNPQGLHFDAPSGTLFETEHGPLGGDEVNRIEAGANYGWPIISYGINYQGADIAEGTHREGFEQPLFYFLPSIAVSPVTVYRGAQFPEWEGDPIIGVLKGKHLARLDLDEGQIRSIYPFLGELNARIRDVKVGPDGAIYVLTQFGMLFRLSREIPPEVPQPVASGAQFYALVCAGCHDTGASGAPMLEDKARWAEIARQPRATINRHTIEGIRDMPERGLCDLCTDEQLLSIVDYMLETSSALASPRAGD